MNGRVKGMMAFTAILLGYFMALLDTTIVNIALPEMMRHFSRHGVGNLLDHERVQSGVCSVDSYGIAACRSIRAEESFFIGSCIVYVVLPVCRIINIA